MLAKTTNATCNPIVGRARCPHRAAGARTRPKPADAADLQHRSQKTAPNAFTLVELLVVIAVVALLATLLVPASANVRPNAQAFQCRNNLRQLASACKMYTDDNSGRIVSAYPTYAGFTATWCGGNATTGGLPGSYVYGGADPTGIQMGLVWPYTKTLGLYHCPTDHRIADAAGVPAQFKGKPILRSISMNSYMGGSSFGANPEWRATNPTGPRDPNRPVYIRETEIRLPRQTFLLMDEDQDSINEGMLFVDVGGSRRFLDLPSRAHRFGCNMILADGHAEAFVLKDDASRTWFVGLLGGLNDWIRLTNLTTHPL